jgi:hypothetical protein
MRISDIMPEDELIVFDKPSRKIRERQGKYVSANDNFLTIQFQFYKGTLPISDLKQGKASIFKNKEAVEFAALD